MTAVASMPAATSASPAAACSATSRAASAATNREREQGAGRGGTGRRGAPGGPGSSPAGEPAGKRAGAQHRDQRDAHRRRPCEQQQREPFPGPRRPPRTSSRPRRSARRRCSARAGPRPATSARAAARACSASPRPRLGASGDEEHDRPPGCVRAQGRGVDQCERQPPVAARPRRWRTSRARRAARRPRRRTPPRDLRRPERTHRLGLAALRRGILEVRAALGEAPPRARTSAFAPARPCLRRRHLPAPGRPRRRRCATRVRALRLAAPSWREPIRRRRRRPRPPRALDQPPRSAVERGMSDPSGTPARRRCGRSAAGSSS